MKILVTGGAGFIGSHIVDAYVEDGHDVVVIDNLSAGKRANVNPAAAFYKADICSPEAMKIVDRERPEILNHHAAQIDVGVSVANPVEDVRINAAGLIGLVEAGRRAGLKKVIFASSGGTVYGEQDCFPASEDHRTQPISPYGINKLCCEQYLYFYEKAYGIGWVSLRYANVYGPRQNPRGEAGVVAIFIERMLSGKQPLINGDGTQTRDYVYVGDVVEANRLALLDRASGAYNVGTGIETDVNQVFKMLRDLSGFKHAERYAPPKPGEQLRSSIMPDRIGKELGWRVSTPLPQGMAETVNWFKNTRMGGH